MLVEYKNKIAFGSFVQLPQGSGFSKSLNLPFLLDAETIPTPDSKPEPKDKTEGEEKLLGLGGTST